MIVYRVNILSLNGSVQSKYPGSRGNGPLDSGE